MPGVEVETTKCKVCIELPDTVHAIHFKCFHTKNPWNKYLKTTLFRQHRRVILRSYFARISGLFFPSNKFYAINNHMLKV